MHVRLKPIIEQLAKISIDEKTDMKSVLALVGRSWYLNNHEPEHYDYNIGGIFDQILNGNDPYEHKKLFVNQG